MKRFIAAGVLALCLMASQIAHADENRDAKIKAEMRQNYLLWQEAWKHQDAERIISFESPDFTSRIETESVHSKEESDDDWRSVMKIIKKVHDARMMIKKLTIEPNRVVILSSCYLDVDVLFTKGPLHRLTSVVQSQEIWIEYDGIWMLKRMEQSRAKVTIDGKPEPS